MARVVVTGASGFFGVSLVSRLVELGHEVTSFGRAPEAPESLRALGVQHVQGDIQDQEALERAFAGRELLHHLAGLVSYRKADRDRLYAVNVEGTRRVMDAALKAHLDRVVHVASIAGLGIPPAGHIGDETIEYNLAGRGLHYCDTKHEGEQIALSYAQKGLNVLALDPGITFGEGDTHPHHHAIFGAIARGRLLGYPSGGVMFSDIRDVVAVAVNSMTLGRAGERYVVGSANLTFREAAVIASRIIESQPPSFPIPGAVSELVGTVCEAIFPLFGWTPPVTRAHAWLSQRCIFFSSDKAIKELGLVQTPFEETVRRTAPYYLQCGRKHIGYSH